MRPGLRITRFDAADDAELAARHAGQQQPFGDQRCGRGRVAVGVVVDLLLPDHLAGVLVQRDELRVQRGEDDEVVIQGRTAVDHVAAGHDAVRQAVLVLPQLGAGLGVEREDARVGRRDEHLAVVDHRLRFLTALLFAAEGEAPHRHQLADGRGVDLLERGIALALLADAPAQHVAGGLGIVLDHLIGHGGVGHGRQAGAHQQAQQFLLHGWSPQ